VADKSDPGALGDIVVTAQRRTENLQTVPIAATVLSADGLKDKAVARLSDLQFASPSLSISDAGLTQSVNIRGIGLASGSPQVTNGVATYVDGLFQPPIVTSTSFYDIASVEVLRGPQGTLVGSNSTGGAIFINTQKPTLDKVDGYAQIDYGNYNTFNLQGAINLPVTDTLAIRAAGNFSRHDSFYKDIGPFDNEPDRLDEKSGRVSVLWKPSQFQALWRIELVDKETGGYAYSPIPGTPFATGATGDIWTLDYNAPTENYERATMTSLELRYETDGGLTFRSLSGYQNKRINNLYDTDGTELDTQTENQFVREREYSEEINIISPTAGRFNWILGGYYQQNRVDVAILNLEAGFPTTIDESNQKITTGIFAQGNYKLTDTLELQAGLRYSHYSSVGEGGVFIGSGAPGFPAGGLQVADAGGAYDDGALTGKLDLNWQLDRNNLIYAFVARGYKPGGFNSTVSTFGPETVWDYEAGWKSTMLNGHVRTQIGGFWNQYHGFQFDVFDPMTTQTEPVNLASATIKGLEAQVQGKLGHFSFDAGGAYVDSKLGSVSIVNTRALASTSLPQCPAGTSSGPTCFDYTPYIQAAGGGPNLYSPKWTYNIGAQYTFQLDGGASLTPRLNYAYVSSQYTNVLYSPVTDLIAAHGLLSALITFRTGRWQLEAYGTNLTNKEYVSGQMGNNEFFGAPREYGIRASVNF
jgi:iron complex outermembrane receptor protein